MNTFHFGVLIIHNYIHNNNNNNNNTNSARKRRWVSCLYFG